MPQFVKTKQKKTQKLWNPPYWVGIYL